MVIARAATIAAPEFNFQPNLVMIDRHLTNHAWSPTARPSPFAIGEAVGQAPCLYQCPSFLTQSAVRNHLEGVFDTIEPALSA
jgi:hypothetical protein